MEYIQMTLADWQNMKKEIERDLLNVKLAFVRIGYNLRQIEEQELYRQDGYKSIAEFAKAEYNLSASTVSRFMAINKRFSINGNSQLLDAKFTRYSSSALQEMLTLPDNDLDMITAETKREAVRELKKFNAEQVEEEKTGEAADTNEQKNDADEQKSYADEQKSYADEQKSYADELKTEQEETPVQRLIRITFKENPQSLDRLYQIDGFPDGDTTKMREIVNPSGSRVVRDGAWIMIMNESDLKYKQFGGSTQTINWEDFFEETDRIYSAMAAEAGGRNILGWEQEKTEDKDENRDSIKRVDEQKAESNVQEYESSDKGDDRIKEERPKTDRSTPGEYDAQLTEKERHGNPVETDGDEDAGLRDEDQGDIGSVAEEGAGQPVAQAQKTGRNDGYEEEKTQETGAVQGEENILKDRMIETSRRLTENLKIEDWHAAEDDIQMLQVWLQTKQET